jgi:hypothetical protein
MNTKDRSKDIEKCCKEVKTLCNFHQSHVSLKPGKLKEFKKVCEKYDLKFSHIQSIIFESIDIDKQS